MAETLNTTRRAVLSGLAVLPLTASAMASPSGELQRLIQRHRTASLALDQLCAKYTGEPEPYETAEWAPSNEEEINARRALLAYTPRTLEEVGTLGRYLLGRITPINFGDFDNPMAELLVAAMAKVAA